MKSSKLHKFCITLTGLICCTRISIAAVNDVFPGDYYPLPAKTNLISLYAFQRQQTGPYTQGEKRFNGQLDSTILAMRLVSFSQLGNTRLATTLVLPWVDARVSPVSLASDIGKQASGLADMRLGLTGWLINQPRQAHYLGISGMLIAPTGKYNTRQLLNPGENRWKFVLSGGWQKDIHKKLVVELSPEIVWYGKNPDFAGNQPLQQRPSYALTAYLRSRITPSWHLFIGGRLNAGGETLINGARQHNPTKNQRLMLGTSLFLPGNQQLVLRIGKDVRIENGFATDTEIVLRYQMSF